MIVNKITGERYCEELLGSAIILISSSTGIKRVITPSKELERVFTQRNGSVKKRGNRSEVEVIPDLVRSIQLEVNYLERLGQKVHLRF